MCLNDLQNYGIRNARRYKAIISSGEAQVSKLLGWFTSPTITIRPIRALGTIVALGIVDPFFVGTSNDAINHRNTVDSLLIQKGQNLFDHGGISTQISVIRVPFLDDRDIGCLGRYHNPNDSFGRTRGIGAIIGQCGQRVARFSLRFPL
jgi:hypothetical protein